MRIYFAVIAFLVMAGCGPRYIPGTKIEETPEKKVIYELVERYRAAVEKRDVEALKEMVSMKYYEQAGTTSDDSDDYGYQQLIEKVFPILKENIKNVQYQIIIKEINIMPDRAYADYEYYWKFLYVDGGKEQWEERNDYNRLEFAKEDGVWRIIRGL